VGEGASMQWTRGGWHVVVRMEPQPRSLMHTRRSATGRVLIGARDDEEV
jgi:hypothetical protein